MGNFTSRTLDVCKFPNTRDLSYSNGNGSGKSGNMIFDRSRACVPFTIFGHVHAAEIKENRRKSNGNRIAITSSNKSQTSKLWASQYSWDVTAWRLKANIRAGQTWNTGEHVRSFFQVTWNIITCIRNRHISWHDAQSLKPCLSVCQ